MLEWFNARFSNRVFAESIAHYEIEPHESEVSRQPARRDFELSNESAVSEQFDHALRSYAHRNRKYGLPLVRYPNHQTLHPGQQSHLNGPDQRRCLAARSNDGRIRKWQIRTGFNESWLQLQSPQICGERPDDANRSKVAAVFVRLHCAAVSIYWSLSHPGVRIALDLRR